jgi:hypothetical protein
MRESCAPFAPRLHGAAERLFERTALQTGVFYQMGRSWVGRFVAAIRLSAAKAEANAVHCVQVILGAPGLSYFIISASGEGANSVWQRDPQLPVNMADRVGCGFKTGHGNGSWTTFIELSFSVA